jgi:transposase
MISLAPGTKVYLSSKPISMRLGFDGLAALVRPLFSMEPYCGQAFLFGSKGGNYLKALHWDTPACASLPNASSVARFVWPPLIDGGVVLSAA